jgi:hypothetical protein
MYQLKNKRGNGGITHTFKAFSSIPSTAIVIIIAIIIK